MCVRAYVCVRACVRARVCVCVWTQALVEVHEVHGVMIYGQHINKTIKVLSPILTSELVIQWKIIYDSDFGFDSMQTTLVSTNDELLGNL